VERQRKRVCKRWSVEEREEVVKQTVGENIMGEIRVGLKG
jgi:hypothetical protein